MTYKANQLSVAATVAAKTYLERFAMPKAGVARISAAAVLAARFGQDRSGSTAMMFALLIMPVMFLTGMAIDYSRMVTVKQRMQTAVDAASLAGVRAQQGQGATAATMKDTAGKYYTAITANLPYVVTTKLNDPTVNTSGNTYTWVATTWMQTPFLSIASGFGSSSAEAGAPTVCAGSKWRCQKIVTSAGVIAASGGNNTGYDIETSFMLDITGSMSGQKLTDLKAAANDVIDILVWDDQSKGKSRVAISPFAQDVRMPTAQAYQAVTGIAPTNATKSVYNNTFYLKSAHLCVGERTGTQKYTDAAPGTGQYAMAEWLYPDNQGAIECDVPTNAAVQPLTADKTVLHNLVNGLQTAGATAGHMGTAWAWYMLSPNFNNLWNSTNAAAAYDTAYNVNTKVGDPTKVKLKKIAILMTDGDYNIQYASQGILTNYFGSAPVNDTANNQATALCTGMKAKGIEVYTVAFGTGISSGSKTLLTNCATDASHFYDASTGDALKAAFRDIALKIAKIRIQS